MTKCFEVKDWFVLAVVTAIISAATIFLFKYPATSNFGIWSGIVGTITAAYHGLITYDDKKPDCVNT